MSYTRLKAVDFGPAKAGLATVRYTLDSGATWITAGVAESAVQPGFYSAVVTFADGFTGLLCWDTHEVSGSVQASEEINDVRAILHPTGLNQIPMTAPAGVAADFREMLVQTWRRLFRKATITATQLKTYGDDGSTVVTTQALTDDGTTQTQGAAS